MTASWLEHIPFELDPNSGAHGALLAHVARANTFWRRCPTGTPVLVIFQGVEAYVSPNWYPSKQETHRQVPTWNYEVVHVHGLLTVHDDERFVGRLVASLTKRHEAAEFIETMIRNIVGIEITIISLVGKAKLSQNKEARDRRNAAQTLEERGRGELAHAMRRA